MSRKQECLGFVYGPDVSDTMTIDRSIDRRMLTPPQSVFLHVGNLYIVFMEEKRSERWKRGGMIVAGDLLELCLLLSWAVPIIVLTRRDSCQVTTAQILWFGWFG